MLREQLADFAAKTNFLIDLFTGRSGTQLYQSLDGEGYEHFKH